MIKIFLFLLLVPTQLFAQKFSATDLARWKLQAKQVTIIRDNWGIPHIYGKTDADAVFGLMYAQCEDDFKRVDMNYVEKLGGLSTVKGESEMYNDLLIRCIIDEADAKKDYQNAPAWLKKLCNAFADGINYYLYKHPEVKPALGKNYQPWYPLLWTDGSIGAINTAGITANDLKNMITKNVTPTVSIPDPACPAVAVEEELTGSNGFAFSPKITESGNAILYINPHVTLYFRPEVHMVSEEGLNVYGAVTWGQFFIYQGFNERCGWMHTSSDVDAADTYIEKLSEKNGHWFYEYNGKVLPVKEKTITLLVKDSVGFYKERKFIIRYTKHGPIMANKNGQWLSVKADNRIVNGLIQCWQRNKTKSFADYKKTMALAGNISNNTVYADAEGNIAYWHGNRIPVRDTKYDWSKPVDGTITGTEWKGLHKVEETVHLYNPPNGWLQNCNSTPYTVAGTNSPKKENYPSYMAPDPENFRGVNAVRVLELEKKYTIEKVIAAGYDRRLAAFEILIPALINTFENSNLKTPARLSQSGGDYSFLAEPIAVLKKWDFNCGENSVATTLAINFGEKLIRAINQVVLEPGEGNDFVAKTKKYAATAKPGELLTALREVTEKIRTDFGSWQIEWGAINRFQRVTGDIEQPYKDNLTSIPVGFASSQWGMLPSFASRTYPGTRKRYGYHGNSFICAVEFGKKVKARSLLAGGESGDPKSPHFFDQGLMYSKGEFKDVLFYKEDVLKHVERKYHPGE